MIKPHLYNLPHYIHCITLCGAHREPCPLVGHVRDTEGCSFVAVGGLLRVSVVQQDALEAPADRGEGQAQLHHLLTGVCDGKERASSLAGWSHLE